MCPLPDAFSASLVALVTDYVERGSEVITDAWQGYRRLGKVGYVHDRRSQRATKAQRGDPGELLPGS